MKRFIVLSMSLLLSAQALANRYAITNATVHTVAAQGSLDNATVLISDGKIQQILTEPAALTGYEVIDASGKVVTPGLIGAYTGLGLEEVSLSAGTVDASYEATAASARLTATGAALDVAYAVNPDSSLFAITRIDGMTSAATGMQFTDTLFRGQGAIISLGENQPPIIKPSAFVTTAVDNGGADANGGSRAAVWVMLTRALEEADYAAGKRFNPQTEWHGLNSVADVEALVPVIQGEIPLLVDARRAQDIRQVIALKRAFPTLKLAILEATEAWRVAEQLAEADIPVILDPESNLPYEFDQLAATMANASRLHAAGVSVSIGINTHNIRLAKQNAGNAVAHGLPWHAALAALTINPARVYGLDEQIGSLEVGKRADVVIWSGDPLQVTEAAEQVFINGEPVEMTSRQTKLRDRYMSLQTDRPHRYTRP